MRVDLSILVIALLIQSFARGFDYLTGDDNGPLLELLSAAWAIPVWGAALLAGGTILLAGALMRRHSVVWLGHAVLWVVYTLLFVGMLIPLIDHRPYFDGVRSVGSLLTPVILHGLFALRMGPRPIDPVRAEQVGVVVGGSDA
jgi:hypothetical protein